MKKLVLAALAALGIMSTAAYATNVTITVGKPATLEWYMCFDRESVMTLFDNARLGGIDASLKSFDYLVEAGKCTAAPAMELNVDALIGQAEIKGEEYAPGEKLVLSVVELSDNAGNKAWAITAEGVIPAM